MVEGGEVDGGTDVISGLTVYPAPADSNRGTPPRYSLVNLGMRMQV